MKHQWTRAELEELFFDALMIDYRSEDYTAEQMRGMARRAARDAVGRS